MKHRFLYLSVLWLLTGGCYNPSRLSITNLSSNYHDSARNFGLSIKVFNCGNEYSRVFYSFNSQALLYQKEPPKPYFAARYEIRYELYNSLDLKHHIDSASLVFTDSLCYAKSVMIADSFDIPARSQSNYVMAFTITDLGKKYSTTAYINIYRNEPHGRNDAIVRDTTGRPLTGDQVKEKDFFRIQFNDLQVYRVFVRYYRREFPLAIPPFSLNREKPLEFKADSIFTIDVRDGVTGLLNLERKGVYHFQTDTSQMAGFTLFNFGGDYPQITTPAEMLGPLRYITTRNEYNDMEMMKNTKQAIDHFWLEKAGNADRARELIRIFYNRVADANLFFSSYNEGWKTDRGMVYIVFGEPYTVYRSASTETWIYGEDRNILSMTLDFEKTSNPFTDNDYTLIRNAEYKDIWYNAVDTWRK